MRALHFPKRLSRPVALAAAACFLAVALGDGCYLGGYHAAAPGPVAPPWVNEPLTAPAGSAESAAALTAMPQSLAPSDGSMFDPETIVPVLDDPALQEVKALVVREAYQPAADKLEAMLAPTPLPSPALLFQLGVLRARSGMPGPAVQAYDRAASLTWPLAGYARLRAARLLVELGQAADALARLDAAAPVSTLVDEAALVRAHAFAALHRIDEGAPFFRAHLSREPRPSD